MEAPFQVAHVVRQNHSCARCAQRKVKCDRKRPCGSCVRHGLDCVFNPLPPRKPRRRDVESHALTDQLRRYETWFRERGIDPGQLLSRSVSDRPVPIQPAQTTHADFSRPKFVDNILWSRVVEEIDNQDDLETTDSDNDTEVTGGEDMPGIVEPSPFLMLTRHSPSATTSSSRPLHPPPDIIRKLWQMYCDNVDPLTKLLHVPTVQKALDNAINNMATVPRAIEALMFSIYATAVMSVDETACQMKLREPRSILLPRYLSAAETALSRAGVLGTTDMVVLQAFLLYLLAIRDIYQPRAVWTLTGVAMRIAEGIGLDQDGAGSFSPFDIEMRRRLWWQLRMHDFRTAELCGRPKFQGLALDTPVAGAYLPTQWPANVNDADLFPEMTGPPLPPLGEASTATDAIFLVGKCELLRFTAARLASIRGETTQNPWELYTMSLGSDGSADSDDLQALEHHLETRYLRYCDPSRPLHLMATLMMRCALNILRFMARHPRRQHQQTTEERLFVWRLCLAILDQQHMLQSNPHLRPFAWHAPFFQQWHAIIHVLDTLRSDPEIEQAARAWDLIEKTYSNNPEMLTGQAGGKTPIHAAVGNLCLKAWGRREEMLRGSAGLPSFIEQLRKMRAEAAVVKKEKESQGGGEMTKTSDMSNVIPQKSGSNTGTETDGDGLDSLLVMNMDSAADINWEQWDTWLAGEGT